MLSMLNKVIVGPRLSLPMVIAEAKSCALEEFREAMERDYKLALNRFWQTIRHLWRGKQFFANMVFSVSGELVTLKKDIVGWWKEYFEDLLNVDDTPSVVVWLKKNRGAQSRFVHHSG